MILSPLLYPLVVPLLVPLLVVTAWQDDDDDRVSTEPHEQWHDTTSTWPTIYWTGRENKQDDANRNTSPWTTRTLLMDTTPAPAVATLSRPVISISVLLAKEHPETMAVVRWNTTGASTAPHDGFQISYGSNNSNHDLYIMDPNAREVELTGLMPGRCYGHVTVSTVIRSDDGYNKSNPSFARQFLHTAPPSPLEVTVRFVKEDVNDVRWSQRGVNLRFEGPGQEKNGVKLDMSESEWGKEEQPGLIEWRRGAREELDTTGEKWDEEKVDYAAEVIVARGDNLEDKKMKNHEPNIKYRSDGTRKAKDDLKLIRVRLRTNRANKELEVNGRQEGEGVKTEVEDDGKSKDTDWLKLDGEDSNFNISYLTSGPELLRIKRLEDENVGDPHDVMNGSKNATWWTQEKTGGSLSGSPSTQLLVEWTVPNISLVTSIDRFLIQLLRKGIPVQFLEVGGLARSMVLAVPDPGSYEVTVCAVSLAYPCPPTQSLHRHSSPFAVSQPSSGSRSDVTAPAQPINVSAHLYNSTTARISWLDHEPGAYDSFIISVKSDGCLRENRSQPGLLFRPCLQVNVSERYLRDLMPGERYSVVVILFRDGRSSPPSLPIAFRTAPPGVRTLEVLARGSHTALLAWTRPEVALFSAYLVSAYSYDPAHRAFLWERLEPPQDTAAHRVTMEVPDLRPAWEYTFRVMMLSGGPDPQVCCPDAALPFITRKGHTLSPSPIRPLAEDGKE